MQNSSQHKAETWSELGALLEVLAALASADWDVELRLAPPDRDQIGLDVYANNPTQENFSHMGVRYTVDRRMPSRHIHYVTGSDGWTLRVTAPGATAWISESDLIPHLIIEAANGLLSLPTCILIPEDTEAWQQAASTASPDTGLAGESITRLLMEAEGVDTSSYERGALEALVRGPESTTPLVTSADSTSSLRGAVEEMLRRAQAKVTSPPDVGLTATITRGQGSAFAPETNPFACGNQIVATGRDGPHPPAAQRPAQGEPKCLADLASRDAIRQAVDNGLPIGTYGICVIGKIRESYVDPVATRLTLESRSHGLINVHVPDAVASRYPPVLLSVGTELACQVAVMPERQRLEAALLSPVDCFPVEHGSRWLHVQLSVPPTAPSLQDVAIDPMVTAWGVTLEKLEMLASAVKLRSPGTTRPRKPALAAWYDLSLDEGYQQWAANQPTMAADAFRRPTYLRDEHHRWTIDDWSYNVQDADLPAFAGILLYSPWLWEAALRAGVDLQQLRALERALGVGRAEEFVQEQKR
ncbi:MAG: hypothetical protein QOG53_1521 [Frankiales bacterium]|jgi:hypothetical protein|nr:hypothetical protein [Frankiales bacterium]